MTTVPAEGPRDILASRWRTAVLYGLPSLVIVASGMTIRSNLVTLDIDSPWRGAIGPSRWASWPPPAWSTPCAAGACTVTSPAPS